MRMRKLSIESLQVQSFSTTAASASARGTVQAHADSEDPTCACLFSRVRTCLSQDPAGCLETGYPCNLVTGPVESCLC